MFNNPFLQKKLQKTLVATPGKYEIRHDAALKQITKEKPAKKSDSVSKPKIGGIRDKLKAAKNESVKKVEKSKKVKVAKESKKINKKELMKKMKKKALREKKAEALRQIKENKDERRKDRQAQKLKIL